MSDHRVRLEALRDKLADALESCSENMLPQLSGQYRATLADLAALPVEVPAGVVEGSVDDFSKRRADRIAAAKAVPGAAGKAVKRGG